MKAHVSTLNTSRLSVTLGYSRGYIYGLYTTSNIRFYSISTMIKRVESLI